MDRKLTRKEKIKARSKNMIFSTIFLIFLLTIPIFVTNQGQIFEEIGKIRAAITEIVNVTSFVFDTIKT